ncbi:hypothetical protein HDU76_012708 [Blyttiomyces sp. JEL0837]|nr:hypothetical protein HDU76_012708 [Blyttiomyces sp. JEL0837]
MISIATLTLFLATSAFGSPVPAPQATDVINGPYDGPLHANSGNYSACPKYTDIWDPVAMYGFEQESYQGEWFTLADTEPTEPPVCVCDRITWTLDAGAKTFTDPLETVCGGQQIAIRQNGTTNPFLQGLRVEGSPDVPGALLGSKNQVLYVDINSQWQSNKKTYRYQNAIVFSCGENYLGQPIFSSLQIFSRNPKTPQPEIDRLIKKAHSLVRFDDSKVMLRQQEVNKCVYPATRLSCPVGCPVDKCFGGMVGVKGVPEPQCLA